MSYTFTQQSFDSLASSWTDLRNRLKWDSVFVLPRWLKVWWQAFGQGAEQYLFDVREDGEIIGIAPLQVRGGRVSLIGSADVCDYLDFVIVSGKEQVFFTVLLDHLKQRGISELYLESLRPDSTVLTSLVDLAKGQGYQVSCTQEGVSLDLDLPSTWEDYLRMLTPKQRREVGRRMRRLEEMGDVRYRTFEDAKDVQGVMDIFLKLLRESREDKAAFMTARMESFFRALADTMAEAQLLRFGLLEVSARPAAAVMCFEYDNKVYLYNSGYDPEYGFLSVGLLSKVLSIKDSIERGRRQYDFLKGAEEYKYRLSGREFPIYSCRIALGGKS